ncbi:MAG: nuclease [Pseudomonas sp. PGPPP4]|uniref:nuclease-related domain-containing protein n=1 Tax=Pseudomonas sp. PGPPP4 TaxID=2015556 RepID=UPI000BDA67A9|nr:nuclease-related domain-containing protein [Pseudomonas sp. PGPPP4]OYT79557.1 MAG: nuclease [Pseudomonas sp. PGPPP4]
MDFSLLAPLAPTLFWLLPLAFVIGLLKSPWMKGYLGELLVRLVARWRLDRQTYRRLHNVTLPTPDGTTQIDHVFLSRYGIFVVETKNLSGWIFGSERQAQWTQKLYKRTFKFQNPLRQNYRHLKALEATLGVSTEHLHSVITLVGGSTFKTEIPVNVTHGIGFIRYIRPFQQPVLSDAQVESMLHALQTGRRAPTLAAHSEHVQNLKRRSDPTAERQCPKCDSTLMIRTVKSGAKMGQQFCGCSAFSKYRVMQSIEVAGRQTPQQEKK